MAVYDVKMRHTEESLESLAHMQYDLFCTRNRVVRTLLSVGMVLLGVSMHDRWWAILAIAYGCYLTTSTYASANRTAHKLAEQIRSSGEDFPGSRFLFDHQGMHILPLSDTEDREEELLPYSKIYGLGEDSGYYYIFRDQYGGYMIPKEQLGNKCLDFRDYIERKTEKSFIARRSPFARFRAGMRARKNRPRHL